MRSRRLELMLWSVASVLLLIAALGARRSALYGSDNVPPRVPSTPAVSERRAPSAETSSGVADHDPFRLERHPSPIPYKAELEGVAPPAAPPKPPKPVLVLSGILGGPPWEALIEGIPGHEGSTVVREGQVISGFTVRSVRRDSVIIRSADTTWRLGLKRSWQ